MNLFLLKRLSTKTLFILTYTFYIICCIAMFFLKDIYLILPCCTGIGILLTSINTLPYQMISEFHMDSDYMQVMKSGRSRGIGIDCALLSSCYFASQVIISLFMSHLIAKFGNRVILVVAAVFSVTGIFLALFFVKFPKQNK